MLYEKHMQWKHYSKALKLLKGYNTTLEYYSGLFDFFFFFSKVGCSNKNPENKLHLLRKSNMFIITSKIKKINDLFLTLIRLTLMMLEKYWHSLNLFFCKTYTSGVFWTQSNICNKTFLWFSQRSFTVDLLLGYGYAPAYIYILVSPTEIICILNIFSIKYIFFLQKKNKLK